MPNGAVIDNVPVWDAADVSSSTPSAFPRVEGRVDADVCVVGLGGSGLSCIGELLRAGSRDAQRIVGVDANSVGSGAAGRNGGFLLAGTAAFYHDAVRLYGHERARRIYALTIEQINTVAVETPEAVRRTGSLRLASSAEERVDCEAHLGALRADGLPAEPYSGPEGTGLLVPTDCAFDPLRRVRILACRVAAQGARLFEGSPVIGIEDGAVVTARGRVCCQRVVVAVDGRLCDLIPELRSRLRDARLQMLATVPTDEVSFPRPVYARWGYDYWQQLENGRVVLGGFRDQVGEDEWTGDASPSHAVQSRLENFLRNDLHVRAVITHRWAATVSYSTTGLPVLEEIRPGLFATGGYSGTGNVLGALCGRAAARLALGDRDEMADLLNAGAD